MLMRSTLMLAAVLLAPLAVQAAPPDPAKVARDVERIKAVLPAGLELAGAYTFEADNKKNITVIKKRPRNDYLQAVARSYLFADVNGDGREDLAVAVEPAPATARDGDMTFGQRALQIYLADGSGKLVLAATGPKVILNADDGGMFGDPLAGLDLNRKGSLRISHEGGAADHWGLVQTFQCLQGRWQLIGATRTQASSVKQTIRTVDVNLLTGDELTTLTQGNRKPVVTRRRVPVQPLLELAYVVAK